MAKEEATYTHGHHKSVLSSHSWRTAENSVGFLLPHIRASDSILDIGCGPGTITVDLASLVPEGKVLGIEPSEEVLNQAREVARSKGTKNISFETADANALPYPDNSFDIVLAHQVLQHVKNPVNILKEMRRVCKPGGRVAARDSDYSTFSWCPASEGLTKWSSLYQKNARANGGEPDAGRYIHVWAKQAGFPKANIVCSTSSWCYSTEEETQWWGNLWSERALQSNFGKSAITHGLASQEDLEEIAKACKDWGQHPDAWWSIPSGEILCLK